MQHKFRIIFQTPSGEQSFVQEGTSIKDVKRAATAEVVKRGGTTWRSERLQDNEAVVEA